MGAVPPRSHTLWTVLVSSVGISSVFGRTAAVSNLGEVAIVSPARAVERLSDARFSQTIVYMATPRKEM